MHEILQDRRNLDRTGPAAANDLQVIQDSCLLVQGTPQFLLGDTYTRAGLDSAEHENRAS